ncbi:MAG: glycosyltransferase family 39 protein [Elusimicrobiota bacterium]
MILILGAGAALRLFHLGHSFRVDEIETWANSQRPLWDIAADLDRLPHASLLCRLAEALLGRGEFFMRLPFAFYGVLTLPLIFLTGRELFDDEVGLLAASLLAVSAFHIGYCQESRYYAPFTFYSLSAFYCLLRLLRREDASAAAGRRVFLAGFIFSHLLNLCLHRMAVYPLALSMVLIVWDIGLRGFRRDAVSAARGWIPAFFILLIVAAGGISQWQWLRDAFFRESGGALSLRMSYLIFHYRDPHNSVAWELLGAYSGGRQAAALLLAAGAAGSFLRGREGLRRTVPLLLWIVVPLGSLAVIRTRTHFEFRYFIFLLPAWLLWAAAGLSAVAFYLGTRFSLREGARRWALLGMVATVVACEAPSLVEYYRLPKARMREVFDFMNASCSAGDAVVMYPAWHILWYGYYRLKGGCRLFHPANLLEGSPAFAPGAIVGAPRRVWLAGTWIADPVRNEEFQRIRGLLSRHCEPEEDRLFQSRDLNDDYHVSSFRCSGNGAPLRRAPASSAARSPRPSFWRRKGCFLLANIPQASVFIHDRWRFSKDLSLVSEKTGLVDAGSRDKILFVWSGEGTLGGLGTTEGFSAGDVFFLPKRMRMHWKSGSASNSVMLELALPGGAVVSGASPRRLGNALDVGPTQMETVLLRGRDWRLVVFRLAPGAEQAAGRNSRPPMSGMLSVLLRGRLRIRGIGYFYPFPGDIFTAANSDIPRPLHLLNTGSEDSAELRLIMEGKFSIPQNAPITSATGKGIGAWPPMLIQ